MLKMQKYEDTKWITISSGIYYRIINGILYIRFVYVNFSFDSLNKWKTVGFLPFEIDSQFDYQINNNYTYNNIVNIRVMSSGEMVAASATSTTVQLAGMVIIPL